jgi:hypothetical protein
MSFRYKLPVIISDGYQICRGCGEVLVNGNAAYYEPTTLDRDGSSAYGPSLLGGYVHQGKPPVTTIDLARVMCETGKETCRDLAGDYDKEAEELEKEVFQYSAAEIYGDSNAPA